VGGIINKKESNLITIIIQFNNEAWEILHLL